MGTIGEKCSNYEGLRNSGLNREWNPDLFNNGAVLHQLSYQAKWRLVVMWVDFKPVDDGFRSMYMMLIHMMLMKDELHALKRLKHDKDILHTSYFPNT